MNRSDLELLWSAFENEIVEKQYFFYQDNKGNWTGDQITSGNSENTASLIDEFVLDSITKMKKSNINDIIIAHNHPNGTPEPSIQDINQERYLSSLLRLSGIKVQDYMIFSQKGYVSFKENNRLSNNQNYYSPVNEVVENLPPIDINTSRSLQSHETEIRELLNKHGELCATTNSLLTSKHLPLPMLLKKSYDVEGKSVFFFKKQYIEGNTQRIMDIFEVFEPIEIYQVDDESFFPLVLNGAI